MKKFYDVFWDYKKDVNKLAKFLEQIEKDYYDPNFFLSLPERNKVSFYKKMIAKTKDGKIKLNFEQRMNDIISDAKKQKIVKLVNQIEKLKKPIKKPKNKNNIVELQNVVKYYHNKFLATKVLKGVNLEIKDGEFVVILGPSGSGKTTLLNLISGMDTPTYGNVIVNHEDITNYSLTQLTKFRSKYVGYIFQQYGLLPNLTVKENVEMGDYLQKDDQKKLDINAIINEVGLKKEKNKYPYELSGGQQQRVSIARSIAKNPKIIFGDEPTGAIDEEMSKQVLKLFVDINKKHKTTVIMVTHNQIIADLATMVIIVANGHIERIIRNKKIKSVDQLDWTNSKYFKN